MPFGKRKDPARPRKGEIDFNRVYKLAIETGVSKAGLQSIRADEETVGGIIHKPMLERLVLCDFAVADLTLPNPNVYYELGVRHSTRQNTTLLIHSSHVRLPFDVAPVRALPYEIGGDNKVSKKQLETLSEAIAKQLIALRQLARDGHAPDSPIHQLIGGVLQSTQLPLDQRLRRIKDSDAALYEMLNVYAGHAKTDVFSKVVNYSDELRDRLAAARAKRSKGLADLDAICSELGEMEQSEAGTIVDLFLSYRALSAWDRMIALYGKLPAVLQRSVLVREQYALALNRRAGQTPPDPGLRDKASRLLEEVTKEIGPNPETQGLLGRVNKDRWNEALARGANAEAAGYLDAAIQAYMSGFKADSRDAYPGINALTLLVAQGTKESLDARDALLPVVRFAVEQKRARSPDYWDHATLSELAVHAENPGDASRYLSDALASSDIESFMPKTTADNLGYLRRALTSQGREVAWVDPIIAAFQNKHRELVQEEKAASEATATTGK
jgi:hypothetical protein